MAGRCTVICLSGMNEYLWGALKKDCNTVCFVLWFEIDFSFFLFFFPFFLDFNNLLTIIYF